MNYRQNIVNVGMISESDLKIFGTGFRATMPAPAAPAFEDLLRAIDAVTTGWSNARH